MRPTARITALLVADSPGNPQVDWLEVAVDADAESVDAVADLFSRYVYGRGVVVNEPFRQDGDGDNLELDPTRPVRVSGYLPCDDSLDVTVSKLDEGLWHLRMLGTVSDLQRSVQKEEDWANAWKDHFQVTRIGKHFVIRPTWREYEPTPEDVMIDLDPGMAFGTGLHPTTSLCMQWLEDLELDGSRVLDAGAGSGILSISAIKRGAASSLSLEVDPVAVSALKHNIELNGLQDRIEARVADVTKPLPVDGQFDLILANIISRILIEAVESLTAAAHEGTRLILSGVIEAHEQNLVDTYVSHGFRQTGRRQIGDWVSLLMVRGPGK